MSKFIQQVSRALTLSDLERLKLMLIEGKMGTTQYLNELAKSPDIIELPKFRFLHYHG